MDHLLLEYGAMTCELLKMFQAACVQQLIDQHEIHDLLLVKYLLSKAKIVAHDELLGTTLAENKLVLGKREVLGSPIE